MANTQINREEFPYVARLPSGQTVFVSSDRTQYVQFSEQMMNSMLETEPGFEAFNEYRKNEFSELEQIVKNEGLERKYCLIYGGKICFHADTKEEIDVHERDIHLHFTRWEPIFITSEQT